MNQQQIQVRQQMANSRSFSSLPGSQGYGIYPQTNFSAVPQPYSTQPLPAVPAASAGGTGSGLLGNFNLKDIKSIIDRMGGIDGVISTVGKVQKIVSSIQQMQPMIRLLMNMLPGKANTTDLEDEDDTWKRKRKRRRKRKSRPKGRKRKAKVKSASQVYRPDHFRRTSR